MPCMRVAGLHIEKTCDQLPATIYAHPAVIGAFPHTQRAPTYRSDFDGRLTFRLMQTRMTGVLVPPDAPSSSSREVSMNLHLLLTPIVSLIAGILILVAPRLLNYIVAIYLILIGLVGLFGNTSIHLK